MVVIKPKLTELLEELLNIGANYKTEELIKIRRKFLDYLADEENLLDIFKNSDHHVLAHDAIKFIDANVTLHRTADYKKANFFAKPVLERLSKIEDGSYENSEWTYYDIVMLTGLCVCTVDMEELDELYTSGLRKAEELNNYQMTAKLMNNFLTRLLYELSFEDNEKDVVESIEYSFNSNINQAITFCKTHSLKDIQYILQILAGLFEGNRPLIDEAFEKLKSIICEQTCELAANKINQYQNTDRYEAKEDRFQYNGLKLLRR